MYSVMQYSYSSICTQEHFSRKEGAKHPVTVAYVLRITVPVTVTVAYVLRITAIL